MATIRRSVLCVMPDGREFPEDFNEYHTDNSWVLQGKYRQAAERAARKAGLRAAYGKIEKIKVMVHNLSIESGKLIKSGGVPYIITLPWEPLTEEKFFKLQDEALKDVPPEFQAFIMNMAYNRYHADGYESVLSCVEDMASGLLPCIKNYNITMGQSFIKKSKKLVTC